MGAAGKPASPSFDFSKVKLFIAIPTRGTTSISFSESLAVSCFALAQAKARFQIAYHQANNFVDMSRNKLLARFLASDCTHIWFIDDDMGWNAEVILKMLEENKDFLAGIGPLKTDSGEDFACNLYSNSDGTTVIEPGPNYLMQAQFVGGAFVLLKREMVEKMRDRYPELRSAAVDPEHGYSFFESKYRPLWMTEDYVFCERWREIGGEIWCFPNISFTHQGTKDWAGNYFEFRVERAKRDQPQETLSEVQGALATLAEPADFISKASKTAFEDARIPESIRQILCASYIDRVAESVIRIQNEQTLADAGRERI